tara:strand:+ start:238 stop:1041 length:804 start_codon:yes stop_codon:yes gene_type:complete
MNFLFDNKKYNKLAVDNHSFYIKAKPFPSIQFKNFINKKTVTQLYKDFPKYNNKIWINHKKTGKNLNTLKKVAHDERIYPDSIRNIFRELNSKQFLLFLETLTGIHNLISDPYHIGGGMHISKKGGYLNIHSDFLWHHKLQLHRRVNVLIYLTPNWKKEYKGALELWNKNKTKKINEYYPDFGSCVIFNTNTTSYHGHPIPLPKDNMFRRVINLYYYTSARKKSEIYNPTFTNYGIIKKSKLKKSLFQTKNSFFSEEILNNYKKDAK